MIDLLLGDSRQLATTLPDNSVNTIVTSPPYWGLRDYGTAKWDGGDAGCDHLNPKATQRNDTATMYGATSQQLATKQFSELCGKCGAVRVDSQLGLERTPEEYVCHLVELFRELRRVLRDDGTLWLNLGDSFAGSNKGTGKEKAYGGAKQLTNVGSIGVPVQDWGAIGLKPKDLVGIPWRVAFALQADGWYLRSDIIWHKPNPMPESVTDRPTKSHEYIFLLSKQSSYYYDADAIKEPATSPPSSFRNSARYTNQGRAPDNGNHKGDIWRGEFDSSSRNRRSVWTVTTKPFRLAHFATFPPDLIRPCILAGCPVGGTVLDPFNGAGTTGVVAVQEGRNYIGLELNPEYLAMSRRRIEQVQPALLPA